MNSSMLRRIITALCIYLITCSLTPLRATTLLQDLVKTDIATGHETKCAMRDKYGYLWIGTSLGVQCYDSNGRSVYDNGYNALLPISNLMITSFCETGDDVFIATNNGLYLFDRSRNFVSKFRLQTEYRVEISSQVEKLFLVGEKYLWICTEGQGFFIYDVEDGSLRQNSRYGSFYTDLVIGLNGLVYTSTINGEIQVYSPQGGEYVKKIAIPDYVAGKNAILLAVTNSDIWISTWRGFYRLNVVTDEIHRVPSNRYNDNINALLARPDGTLLIGSNSGLWSYNPINDNVRQVISANNVGDDYDVRIIGLSAEANGEIIVIHPTGPIDVLSTQIQSMRFYPLPADYASNHNQIVAMEVAQDSTGFWAGTENGLYYFDMTQPGFNGIKIPEMRNMSITALLLVGDRLWIGTKLNGVIVYDTKIGKTVKTYTFDESTPYSLISNKVNSIYAASDGKIYLLTDWGICYYNESEENFMSLTEFNHHARATAMQEDSNGGQWIATLNNGLFYREQPTGKFLKADWCRNLVSLPIINLYRDSSDRLWAMTKNHGIFIYNEASNDFVEIDIPISAEKAVSFLTEDFNRNIWSRVNNMLVEIDQSLQARIYHFVNTPEMMPVIRISTDNRNYIIIGSRNGFYTFDPNKVNTCDNCVKALPKSITFPNVKLDEETIKALNLNSLLYMRRAIELPYEYNTFNIGLSSIHPYTEPNIQFDYFLEGYDKSWRIGNYSSEISYSNIPFGEYRLLMRPHGLDNSTIYKLAITVLPPWYLTTTALIVYLILFALFGYGLFLFIRRLLRKNMRRKINEVRLQNERELFEAKTRYFVDLVHEIRTPLMLISLPLEQLTASLKNDVEQVAKSKNMVFIRSMQHNIDYLLGITNQLLDFRKVENNSDVKLNIVQYNISSSMRKICQRFDEPLRIQNLELIIDFPEEDVIIAADADKIDRILMNLVGNAMKYASHKIMLRLSMIGNDMVEIKVGDDGPGVPKVEREKIFDTYYQIGNDNVATSLGTGLGLAYSKLVAEAHKGYVAAGESEFGGALFTLMLPMGDVAEVAPEEVISDKDSYMLPDSEILLNQDKTILLVEDNKELRDMISGALCHYCKVLTAVDGLKALDVLQANHVDVIVSDVMMPRMDGIELCQKVKGDLYNSQILFLILTAKTGAEAHEIGMKSGADVYLEKPFSVKHLIYQINNLLRTRQKFYELVRNNKSTTAPISAEFKPVLNRMDADFLARMNDFISESIRNEEFSIDTLAEKMNMSRSSFYRKITMIVGMSPSEYLKNFRLTRAAELLVDGCRISEVSNRVGFASSSYFAKCFKEKFEVLPSEYVASLPTNGEKQSDSANDLQEESAEPQND